MKPDNDSSALLRRLHERVFTAPEVRAVLDARFARLAAELQSRPEPPHAACVIPIDFFTAALPAGQARQVRLCRLFLLRRGARMAVPERHCNSVQRLVSYRGKGRIHQEMPGGGPEELRPRAIFSPLTSAAADDDRPGAWTAAGADDPTSDPTDCGCHWDIVPAGVWHVPEAAEDGDWATVTFHSAAEDEIVDELWRDGTHRRTNAAPREGAAG